MGRTGVSFSDEVRQELARHWPARGCCRRAELAALIAAAGRRGADGGLALQTDQAPVARKVLMLSKSEFGLATEVVVHRRRRLRKNLVYAVRFSPQRGLEPMLRRLCLWDGAGLRREPDDDLLDRDCCRRAYLRGVFLGAGWVGPPARGHHLELHAQSTDAAEGLGQMLFAYGIPVRLAARKDHLLLYLKEGEQVARFLSLVGAHQAVLHYEDVRAFKEMKNRVNRQMNFDTANLNKTVEASARQLAAIRRLQAGGGLERLPAHLRQLAELRLQHPEASLKELGEMMRPPVGKSGVNHRMRLLERWDPHQPRR